MVTLLLASIEGWKTRLECLIINTVPPWNYCTKALWSLVSSLSKAELVQSLKLYHIILGIDNQCVIVHNIGQKYMINVMCRYVISDKSIYICSKWVWAYWLLRFQVLTEMVTDTQGQEWRWDWTMLPNKDDTLWVRYSLDKEARRKLLK